MPDNIPPPSNQTARGLTYTQKFFLISFVYTLSLFLSVLLVYGVQVKDIRSLQLEIIGNTYINSLNKLIQDIIKHQLLVKKYLKGDLNLKEDIATLQLQINTDFCNVIANNANFSDKVSATNRKDSSYRIEKIDPNEIEKNWDEFSTLIFKDSDSTTELTYQQLIGELNELERNVAISANLYFDGKLSSSLLTNNLIDVLPQGRVTLSNIIAKTVELSKNESITLTDKIPLIEYLGILKSNIERTKETINKFHTEETDANENTDLKSQIWDTLSQYAKNVNQVYLFLKNDFILSEKSPQDLNAFYDNAYKALQGNYSLRENISAELNILLTNHLSRMKQNLYLTLGLASIGAIFAFLLGYSIIKGITKPLNTLVEASKRISSGDLSVRIPIYNQNEVGLLASAFNQMAYSFHEVIGQLQWAGIQLATSTTEIAAAAKQQEATILEQEVTTKEIAVTAKEISSTAKDFAKTMSEVSRSAEQSSALAVSGKAGLSQMETIMRQMVEASSNIAAKLAILNEKADTITGVITTISKVADQTNLLSLNAAIEAEKAGEHGRSFAVIAREIRRLADQTANATLDIERMVNEIVSAVSAGVMGVDKFSEEINTGVSQAAQVSEQLTKIIEQVQLQTSSFEIVNQGMQAQSLGAEQINQSIIQLSESAQQTTSSIRQFHKAIEQLNNAAQEMQTAVAKIKH